jgi:hypothetical protein
VPLVLDLRIAHDRFGSSSDPSLNGHLHYPMDIDGSINEAAADKIQKYRADCNNKTQIVMFRPIRMDHTNCLQVAIKTLQFQFHRARYLLCLRLHSEFIRLLFLQTHRETDRFFAASGVPLAQSTSGGFFHFRRAAFFANLKSKSGNLLAKAAALRINLNLVGASIASKSHTHPSHSQTSRLLTSSLSLGVPVPRPTQCMRGA